MNQKQLKKLIEQGESQYLDFKKTPANIGKDICGFANTNDGIILVGVADDGKPIGVSNKDEEQVANSAYSLDKPVYPEITKINSDGKTVLMVKVKKSSELHTYKGYGYKRVGSTDKPMSIEELVKKAQELGIVKFDSEVCNKATLKNIDWDFVKEFFVPRYEKYAEKEVVGSHINLLEALGCVKEDKPTNAGILLFGKNPQEFFRNGYIALVRYRGREVGIERLDHREFRGNLFKQIDECDRYIKEHIMMMGRLLPYQVEREDIPEYPWFSIRELTINATTHRDYAVTGSKVIIKMFDDHMEYYNPGGLLFGITPDNIVTRQHSRNEVIASVLSKIKYIEEVGEGWDKIIKEHKEHPLKPLLPKITADEYSVMVEIFSTREKFEEKGRDEKIVEMEVEVNERQRHAVEYLKEKQKITNKGYQDITGTNRVVAFRDLNDLVEKNIIEMIKKGRGTYYRMKR